MNLNPCKLVYLGIFSIGSEQFASWSTESILRGGGGRGRWRIISTNVRADHSRRWRAAPPAVYKNPQSREPQHFLLFQNLCVTSKGVGLFRRCQDEVSCPGGLVGLCVLPGRCTRETGNGTGPDLRGRSIKDVSGVHYEGTDVRRRIGAA